MGCLTAKASGSIASFITPTVTPIESARVYFSPTQLGEGTPSPENVREIVGRTSVELKQCGKNLFGGDAFASAVSSSMLNEDEYGRFIRIYNNTGKNPIYTMPFKANTQYTFIGRIRRNATSSLFGLRIIYTDDSVDVIFGNTTNANEIATLRTVSKSNKTIKGLYYLQKTINSDIYYDDFGIFEGVVPISDFEPYQGTTIPFSWKRLPDEYQEVEYIESDGGQYIDLPFGFDDTDEIVINMSIDKSNTRDSYIVAPISWNTNGNRFGIGVYVYYTFAFGDVATNGTQLTPNITNDGLLHTWTYKNRYVSMDNGCSLNCTSIFFGSTTANLRLFYGYNSNTLGKIAYYKHKKANGNEYEFIPCYRKSDNEIGMFDTVSQTFYTNQGTGTFTKGDDVFSDEVYGGYVDLVKGEIVETYGKFVFTGDENISWHGWGNDFYIHDYIKNENAIIPFVTTDYTFCNMAEPIKSRLVHMPSGNISITGADTLPSHTYLVCSSDGYGDSLEECKAKLKELYDNRTPLMVVTPYKTAFIKTHPLSDYLKTQLQTLKNENTFWSDADSVEIDYGLAETFDIQKAKRKIIMNQPHIETALNSSSSSQVIKFKTDMKAPLKQCIVNFAPIQEGSGDPSPDNIRPIKGWNGITLNHTGINMLNCSSPSYYYDATNNGITSKSTKNENGIVESIYFNGTTTGTNIFRNLNFIPAKLNNITIPSGRIALTTYSSQVYIVPMGQGNIPRTVNGKAWDQAHMDAVDNWTEWNVNSYDTYEGLWIRAQILPRQTDLNINTTIYPMMCLAEDKGCEFEPYKGESFDVDWTNDVGTVYGGYVDLVSGKLVGNWIKRDLTEMSTIKAPDTSLNEPWNHRFVIENWDYNNSSWDKVNGRRNFIIDNIANDDKGKTNFTAVGIDNSPIVYIYDNTISTVEEFKTKYSEHYICYETRFPIHYSLTPQQLITLKGQNNLWADTNGTIDVKYWKH